MKFRHLLFDLDNTLYPASSAMDTGITQRMLECVASFFNCSLEQAKIIRKERITNFSTTLEWLRSEGLKDTDGFLNYVHPESEKYEVPLQPALREFLLSIPLPKSILTNSNHVHAERVLKTLGVFDLFETITDITDANFKGKPYPLAYKAAVEKINQKAEKPLRIEEILFFDDMQKYTDGWNVLGGTSVLIGNKNGCPIHENSPIRKIQKDCSAGIQPGKTIKLNDIYELTKKDIL